MQTLGIVTMNTDSEKNYFLGIAREAKQFGYSCYLFSPQAIVPNKETVYGFIFSHETDSWERSDFQIPNVLYDRCFYKNEQELKKYSPIMKWLKSRDDLIFLGNGLPNKWIIHETLKSVPQVAPYLPETRIVKKVKDVFQYVKKVPVILLKPLFGSQGRGIFQIQKIESLYLVKTVKQNKIIEKELTSDEMVRWLRKLLENHNYLMQPFLHLSTEDHKPFDIRILVQKDGNGKWNVRGKGLRIGPENSIISNIAGGGKPSSYEEWLKKLPKEKQRFCRLEIEELSEVIPELLETKFHRLFEVGIDISVDQKGAIWLLEVNSKPGRSVLIELNPEMSESLYKAPYLYAEHLLNSLRKGDKQNEEILSN